MGRGAGDWEGSGCHGVLANVHKDGWYCTGSLLPLVGMRAGEDQESCFTWALVAHAYNPSYLGC
jgi:hypothetical protein